MKYKKIVVEHKGEPERMKITEVETRPLQSKEVQIRTQAIGISYADVWMRRGTVPLKVPFTPGADVIGVVEEIGEDIADFKKGQVVLGTLGVNGGGYSEVVYAQENQLVQVPEDINPSEAVSLVVNYLTASQLLKISGVKKGDGVLIHGAGGGVGTALLQLGGTMGLTMYGTASAKKTDVVKNLGGIPIDYKHEDFLTLIHENTDGGVSAVFDPQGGIDYTRRSYQSLRKNGKLVTYGFGSIMKGNKNVVMPKIILQILGLLILNLIPDGKRATFGQVKLKNFREDITPLLNLLKEKKIKPVISAEFPLVDAVDAHKFLESGEAHGKLILKP